MGAVQGLGLQPAQAERIRKAVLEALRESKEGGSQDPHILPGIVRIWISRARAESPSPSNLEAQQAAQCEGRGWGAFLIQKRAHGALTGTAEADRTIELYLYQESGFSRGQSSVKKE
jgi:hypothetical protein